MIADRILSLCSSAIFSSLFSLMLRPPPKYTLFPYTTLFRSSPASKIRLRQKNEPATVTVNQRMGGGECRKRLRLDRKSTRLNSSHANISYAVFCLKKKK